MSSIGSSLPGEVVDHIIDFLHNDIHALQACALVAYSWTPSAHYHAFDTIISYPDKPGRTVEEVLAWVSSDGARVSRYITTLVVQRFSNGILQPRVRIRAFALLKMQLPSVCRVTLREVIIDSVIAPPPPTFHDDPHSRPLIQLSVLFCRTNRNRFYPILHLLGLFPAIDQLHYVHNVCSWDPTLQSTTWFQSLLRGFFIRELFIHCETQGSAYTGFLGLCRMVECAETPWPLQRLALTVPKFSSTSTLPLDSLLNPCKRSLVDLRLNVNPSIFFPIVMDISMPMPGQWHTQTLKECTSLETMRLHLLTLSDITVCHPLLRTRLPAAWNEVLDANVELVLSAPSQLTSIIITFLHLGTWDAQTAAVARGLSAWRRLDDAFLLLRHLTSVVCVCISNDTGLNVAAQEDLLRSLPKRFQLLPPPESSEDGYVALPVNVLPRAAAAGLLRIAMTS